MKSVSPPAPDGEANPLLEEALTSAARGWAVIPLHGIRADGGCTCGNPTCTSPSKHPRTANGLHDATTDEETIRQWWTRWSDANLGIVTGAVSGLLVLDEDGVEGAETLCQQKRHIPPTAISRTGGGGRHYYFQHPGFRCGNTTAKIGNKVDTRGDGGYVVAPGSIHASGNPYEWIIDPHECPPAPAPGWLVQNSTRSPRCQHLPSLGASRKGSGTQP